MKTFTKLFRELTKKDAPIAGGKGASLGEMFNAGIPVPPGFVVTADAFEQFLNETNLNTEIDAILHTVKHEEMHTIENASERIQALILNAQMPKDIARDIHNSFKNLATLYVAVRSSATAEDSASAAWAGQLDSHLNTTKKNLLENVQRCWASLFTPRAIFYRFEKGLHKEKISVAVVVQKMVESEISGIAFSVHPVTQDYNQLIIEAGLGLGEAIVSGQITPDSYVIEKNPRGIIDKHISEQEKGLFRKEGGGNEWKNLGEKGKKQVLTDSQILTLSEIVLTIEKHYGFPCDIEWAFEKGKFYIVQSRPITTLTDKKKEIPEVKMHIGHSSEYQILFQIKDLPYLINDILTKNYAQLHCLFLSVNGIWMSYLPRAIIERTLQEGLHLFSDKNKFLVYKKEFENYKKESSIFFEKTVKKKQLTQEEVKKFLEEFIRVHTYYIKTEFFYMDRAFLKSSKNSTIRENLRQMENIKNSGREHINKIFFGEQGYLNRVISILSKQFNLPREILFQYSQQEILSLFTDKQVDDNEIKNRKQSYLSNGKGYFIENKTGEEAYTLSEAFLKEDNLPTTQLKGVPANKGKTKGRVKVLINDYQNFDKLSERIQSMNKGDILVADTTSPEFMPACKKASAILTNQGGLLSHAAIVSRELGIPCIVGLGKITHLVKDGDEVEVDADNGIVRIIKEGEKK